jgi:hypothetical protein
VFVLSTNRKGAIAETAIAAAATKLGVSVLRPIVDHARYDLAFEIGDRILRVQCKWGQFRDEGAVIRVNLTSSWCTPTGYERRYSGRTRSILSPCIATSWTAATFCRASSWPGVAPST